MLHASSSSAGSGVDPASGAPNGVPSGAVILDVPGKEGGDGAPGGGGSGDGASAIATMKARCATASEQLAASEKRVRKKLTGFYKQQEIVVERFSQVEEARAPSWAEGAAARRADADEESSGVRFLVGASFYTNVALFMMLIACAIYSGSLAVVATAVDSSLDIISTSVMLCTNRISGRDKKRTNRHKWPIGKGSRLEPLSIVIFASIMATAAMLLIIEGIQSILNATKHGAEALKVDAITYGIVGAALAMKFALYLLCVRLARASSTAKALALDHLNDVITDTATLVVLALLANFSAAWWLDPAAAIALGARILISWVFEAREHAQQLSGRALPPEDLAQVLYLALHHDARIQFIDTVRAYHIGAKAIVEVDIVLDPSLPLPTAHDIAESLQKRVEELPLVERAYVHIDTEFSHKPDDEHRVPWEDERAAGRSSALSAEAGTPASPAATMPVSPPASP